MRKGCYKLYDRIWERMSPIIKERSSNEKGDFALDPNGQRFYQLKNSKRKGEVLPFFAEFRRFYEEYGREYNSCRRYIYGSNINENVQRHWMFAYVDAYMLLNQLNYFFDCSQVGWYSNPIMEKTQKRAVSDKALFAGCGSYPMDLAFERAPEYLATLKSKYSKTYRYLDYDRFMGGTHLKVFNWVRHENRVLPCQKDEEGRYINEKLPTFPKGAEWIKRHPKKEKKKGLIY